MNLLNAQGHCASYSRALIIETALANAVVENTKQCQGLYVPPFLKNGTFVFFASDTQTLLRAQLLARVPHMGQSLPSTRRLMHLVNQAHPLFLRIGDTKSKSLLVTHTIQPCYRVRSQKQLHRNSGRGSSASTTLV